MILVFIVFYISIISKHSHMRLLNSNVTQFTILKKNQYVNIPFDRAIAFVDYIMHGEFVACHKM